MTVAAQHVRCNAGNYVLDLFWICESLILDRATNFFLDVGFRRDVDPPLFRCNALPPAAATVREPRLTYFI